MAAKKMGQDWKQESDNAPRRLTEWERAIIDGFFMWRLVANLRWVVSFWAIFFHIRQRTKHGTDEVMATWSRPDSFLSGLWLGKSVCSTVDKSQFLAILSYQDPWLIDPKVLGKRSINMSQASNLDMMKYAQHDDFLLRQKTKQTNNKMKIKIKTWQVRLKSFRTRLSDDESWSFSDRCFKRFS